MSPRHDDPEERRRQIALFRHAIIGELDVERLERGELTERVSDLAAKTYHDIDGNDVTFSERTIWAWWSAYSKKGLEGLLPKVRKDKGTLRAFDPGILEAAAALRRELPSRSTSTLIHILETARRVAGDELCRSTLDRHLAEMGVSRRILKTLGDKRFIRLLFERPNQLWVGDYHEAPILWIPEREAYRTIHLCAFIDHYSKLVPWGEWYTSEQIATLEDSLKKSILRRGRPDAIYVDNGSAYRATQFAFALDRLSIKLRHSKAYTSEGRGAIERFNRTVVEQFEPEIRQMRISDLAEINLRWQAWLEMRYHLQRHEATGESPLDRFSRDGFTPTYPDPVELAETFRVRVRRRVHPKTSTVQVDDVHFVVEMFLRKRWVEVHYDPHCLDDVIIYFRGKRVQRALPQQPNEQPLPRPERPTAAPPSFDYLGALRAEYDRRIVAEARNLSYAQVQPDPGFSLPEFLSLCAEYIGRDLAPYERDELVHGFNTVGPISEATTRQALEHALRVRGRGHHVSIYSHYLRVFHLSATKALEE